MSDVSDGHRRTTGRALDFRKNSREEGKKKRKTERQRELSRVRFEGRGDLVILEAEDEFFCQLIFEDVSRSTGFREAFLIRCIFFILVF